MHKKIISILFLKLLVFVILKIVETRLLKKQY